MEGSSIGDSTIQDSTINMDAYKHNVVAHNSPIIGLTINHFHGDSQAGRSDTEYRSDVHQAQMRVTFADQEMSRIRDSTTARLETSQVPPTISRLLNTLDKFARLSGPAYPMDHGCSITGKTTTTGGRPSSHFRAIEESRQTMKDKLKPQVRAAVIRKYMQSEFFFSHTAIPLWEPSPGVNSPEAIKTCNVCVGDVGFFTQDGGFQVLFNAFLSYTDNTRLGFTPPHDFEPYGPVRFSGDVSKITPVSHTDYVSYEGDFKPDPEIHPERNYIRSYCLDKKKARNHTTPRSGTLLDLPNGFWRDRMHSTMVLAKQGYFDLHAESWYNHFLKRLPGPTNPEGHLYIISGSYKCNAWALAFCSTTSPDHIFARLYKLYPDSEIFYEWDRHGAVVGRKGPLKEEIADGEVPLINQCVAVEVHSIKLSSDGIQKVGASVRRFMSKLSIRSRTTVKSRTSF